MDIGVDEAGRGPLFGRVYAAAVILPPSLQDNEIIRDSKKIKSQARLAEAAAFVKDNATAWAVCFASESEIDTSNILSATMTAMHRAIKEVLSRIGKWKGTLLIDGNYFKPYISFTGDQLVALPHECYEKGDARIKSIAAASILAKYTRDCYIADLVSLNPILDEWYSLSSNKGYGTSAHIAGLKKHGTSEWHRKSFGICRELEPWVVGRSESTSVTAVECANIQGD